MTLKNESTIKGKPGGSSAPSNPGAGGSSQAHGGNGGNPFSGIKDMTGKMGVFGGGGSNPSMPGDIPSGYQAPKIPSSDNPLERKMAVSGSGGGSSAPRKN